MPDDLTLNATTDGIQLSTDVNIANEANNTNSEPTYNADRFSLTIGPDGSVSRSYSNNGLGHFCATENVFSNGDVVTHTDAGSQIFTRGTLDQNVIGHYCGDFRGNHSTSVDGLFETRVNTKIDITGSPELYFGGYQELADDLQTRAVAARSQSEQEPDTSLVGAVKDMLKPAPNLKDCIKQPKADELQDNEDLVKPPTLLQTVWMLLLEEIEKIAILLAQCNLHTLMEMAKIQKNYMKDKAKKCVEAKKKLFENMPDFSMAAFKKNMGDKLFPDGEFSIESLQNLAAMADPANLLSLFISPSTQNLPKKQNFDPQQYQKIVAEDQEKVVDVEKHIC